MENYDTLRTEFAELVTRIDDRYRKLSSSKVNFIKTCLTEEKCHFPENATNRELIIIYEETHGFMIRDLPMVLVHGNRDVETLYVLEVDHENLLLVDDEDANVYHYTFDMIVYLEYKLNLVNELELVSPIAKLEKFINKI